MRDGLYVRGKWQPLPEDERRYLGKAAWYRRAWWVLAMGVVMISMGIAGFFTRRGRAQ